MGVGKDRIDLYLGLGRALSIGWSSNVFSGVRRAVDEFVTKRQGCWSLEVVSMPTRGDYQGLDYSLAILSRCRSGHGWIERRQVGPTSCGKAKPPGHIDSDVRRSAATRHAVWRTVRH